MSCISSALVYIKAWLTKRRRAAAAAAAAFAGQSHGLNWAASCIMNDPIRASLKRQPRRRGNIPYFTRSGVVHAHRVCSHIFFVLLLNILCFKRCNICCQLFLFSKTPISVDHFLLALRLSKPESNKLNKTFSLNNFHASATGKRTKRTQLTNLLL